MIQNIQFTKNIKKGFVVATLPVIVTTVGVRYVNVGVREKFENDIKKLAARDYLQSSIEMGYI